ncbi:MAG: putative phosphoserine phosphatase/1-acylglycerol-3-phosphate O-acyltransferase [Kiritimatiellia bacterium]|jgi:putative phosphoserine phosphatase/1-acylglycerol-3-phosphate O-acyltransferase
MIDELLREIRQTPDASGVAAFFDMDRTVVHGFTAHIFLRERIRRRDLSTGQLGRTVLGALQFSLGRQGFSAFLVQAAEMYAGKPEIELIKLGEQLFQRYIAARIYPEARALIQAHKQQGHRLVLVTSATRYQAEPLAKALGFDDVLCSRFEIDDGVITGRVERPTCYGIGKLRAASELAHERGLDLGRSWFYSDGAEDLPLLEAVGYPRVLNPDRRLERKAKKRSWPIVHFRSRGARPTHMMRTGAGIGSLFAAVAAGLPVLAVSGDTRRARNITVRVFGDAGTVLSGIDVTLHGEENVWAHRPCVFIFNHQSAADALILAKVLRRDIVPIGKKELKSSVFRPVFDYAGTVFIDRFDRGQAIEALKPVVESLGNGNCIIIAPEGTRSVTPSVGRFKKGAFHIARQAGVPIVPVVIRNAMDALPKKGRIVHPAKVEVFVLPGIPTEDWTVDEVGERADEVRRLFVELLED